MEFLSKLLVCFLAGAGAGIGTGFVGMSAAAIIGPMLSTFLNIPSYQAIGIGLASDVLASAVSAFTYKKNDNLDIRNSMPLIVSVLCATVVGSYASSFIPEWAMDGSIQIVMIIVGCRFLFKPVTTTKEDMNSDSKRVRTVKAIAGGIIVGLICGSVGAGGGIMLLFVLTTFLKYELHTAVGTSVFIMSFIAFTGSISHFALDDEKADFLCLILCVVFTFVWARIAAKIANKAKAETLNKIVGIIMITTAVVVLFVNNRRSFTMEFHILDNFTKGNATVKETVLNLFPWLN